MVAPPHTACRLANNAAADRFLFRTAPALRPSHSSSVLLPHSNVRSLAPTSSLSAPAAAAAAAAWAQEHRRIRGEYEARLRELEAERHNVEADLAQVDRYKQLLLKQRDIMIALTTRLNERDEQIMTLQEELEAYDRHQRLLEDSLDSKTAELIAARRAALEAATSGCQQVWLADWLTGSFGWGW
jgi:hypothetical protein